MDVDCPRPGRLALLGEGSPTFSSGRWWLDTIIFIYCLYICRWLFHCIITYTVIFKKCNQIKLEPLFSSSYAYIAILIELLLKKGRHNSALLKKIVLKFCTHCHWNRNQFKKVLNLKSTVLNYFKKNQFLYSLLKITMTDFYQLFGQRMNFISYLDREWLLSVIL